MCFLSHTFLFFFKKSHFSKVCGKICSLYQSFIVIIQYTYRIWGTILYYFPVERRYKKGRFFDIGFSLLFFCSWVKPPIRCFVDWWWGVLIIQVFFVLFNSLTMSSLLRFLYTGDLHYTLYHRTYPLTLSFCLSGGEVSNELLWDGLSIIITWFISKNLNCIHGTEIFYYCDPFRSTLRIPLGDIIETSKRC